MRILLIGSGAREHILGEKLKESPQPVDLFVFGSSRNPGLTKIAFEYQTGKVDDTSSVLSFTQKVRPDFAVIGPEAPLAAGVVDALQHIGIPSVGPTKAAAQLESSKSFTRNLLVEAGINVYPRFKVFDTPSPNLPWASTGRPSANRPLTRERDIHISSPPNKGENKREGVSTALEQWIDELGCEFVVKPDGLTGGKGVKVQGDHFQTTEDGIAYAKECLEKDGSVLIEEKLIGQEFSLMSFTDGTHLLHMPAVQDNKRLLEGDRGPNTGGMGSVSDADHSLPFLTPEDIQTAQRTNERVIKSLSHKGIEYRGIIYGNYIAVKNGIKLIEYNARFGDPETMNVLAILESDFVAICRGIIDGNLDTVKATFAGKATVCKYVVPEGYPENPVKNVKIDINQDLPPPVTLSRVEGSPTPPKADVGSQARGMFRPASPVGGQAQHDSVRIYFASVDVRPDGLYLTGSRAIGVVGIAGTLAEAERLAETEIKKIQGPVVHRSDIGTKELIEKRIEMMKQLRS